MPICIIPRFQTTFLSDCMAVFWFFTFTSLIVLDRLHRTSIRTLAQEHQFRLYELRDELREAVMRGEVNSKSWVFLYLDSSIARTITVLERLTLVRLVLGALFMRDYRSEEAHQHLMRELAKESNAPLAAFHRRYIMEIGFFLIRRHATLRLIIPNVARGITFSRKLRKAIDSIVDRWQRAVEALAENPDTSTLEEYALARQAPGQRTVHA